MEDKIEVTLKNLRLEIVSINNLIKETDNTDIILSLKMAKKLLTEAHETLYKEFLYLKGLGL